MDFANLSVAMREGFDDEHCATLLTESTAFLLLFQSISYELILLQVIDSPQEPLFIDRPDLTERVLRELHPYVEAWTGVELTPYTAYGLRLYTNQSALWMHVSTHFDFEFLIFEGVRCFGSALTQVVYLLIFGRWTRCKHTSSPSFCTLTSQKTPKTGPSSLKTLTGTRMRSLLPVGIWSFMNLPNATMVALGGSMEAGIRQSSCIIIQSSKCLITNEMSFFADP